MELAKTYDPHEAQQRWLKFWDEKGYFHSEPDPKRQPFTIVIPPPNVTGALHLGHALNNTLQDVLIRWRRMQGYNALWIPGTDHAGIATQAVVERLIFQQEKKTRHDLGREELVKRIWQWKDKYEARILGQLKQLGCSCDWARTRFTLDPICARAVRQTFFDLFKAGLIFRGKRLVNWDTSLQTSVADDETYTEDIKGSFWTFKYPVTPHPNPPPQGGREQIAPSPLAGEGWGGGEFIRFSTTRPETILGDTAVCVHPSDERYKHLIGKQVTIPLVNRDIPIIADGLLADPTLGTGCVKVTPAHDPNDYACYQRNPRIGIINILNPDGTINENGGKYQGMDRYKAREAVVADMEALGLFEGKEDREIPMKYSDRSKTPIEPYLSDQWFVKMGDLEPAAQARGPLACAAGSGLAQMAMDAVTDGRVKFVPERYAKTYLDWLGEKRDWCISRQLWWGHRIPVWKHSDKTLVWGDVFHILATNGLAPTESNRDQFCVRGIEGEIETPEGLLREAYALISVAPGNEAIERKLESLGFQQDPDVLDTWFSSMLWPHSTLGWPEQTPELKYYYPTNVLVTSRDIITLWVARMVIAGLFNLNEVPFHQVYIHPKILDGFGETMSKMKGNGIDPLDIIDRYGTDALRYGMVHIATETQDNRMPVSNICPHCQELVPVKQEHMGLRTRKITCPHCKQPFRPGGPWPTEDAELKTAKQSSERFEVGRNFANKIWNAARFILLNLDGYVPASPPTAVGGLPLEDRWILSRLASTTAEVTAALEGFHFSEAARAIYEFVWSEFCDWYIEMSKGRLALDESRAQAQRVLFIALDGIVRLIQPIMPFLAESLWQEMSACGLAPGSARPESVVIAPWPEYPAAWQDATLEKRMARMQKLVKAVREVRNQYQVDPKRMLDVHVRCTSPVSADFAALTPFVQLLAGVGELKTGPEQQKPTQAATHIDTDFEVYVSLQGLIDVAAERKRMEKQLAEKRKHLASAQAKLDNPSFRDKAPAEVVQQQQDLLADLQKQIAILEANLKELNEAQR